LTSFIDKENWQGCHFRIQICTIKKIQGKKKETDHYTKLAAAKPYSPKNVDLLAYSSTLLEVRSYYIYNSSKPYIPVSQLNAI